jgi:predicted phosphodiesterase
MADSLGSALVLLGDPHLGASFHGETQLPPLSWGSWVRLLRFRGRFDRFFTERCVAHNKAIVAALPRYLRRELKAMREREGFPSFDFDQYVLLGDLVTWPSPASFAFLKEYVTRDDWAPGGGTRKVAGLHLAKDKIIVVPGNHDKLLRRDLNMFRDRFTGALDLESPPPQQAIVVRRRTPKHNFVFFVVDANRYTMDPELEVTMAARTHLASGIIGDSLVQQVGAAVERYASEDAIRVLVLHYAVDHYSATQLSQLPLNTVLPHEVAGLEQLLDAIPRGGVNFAVHGHLHRPGLYNHRGIPVVSVGTAFQRGPTGANDFYVIKIFESGQISAEHHIWAGTGFRRDPDETLSRPLN